MPNMDGFEATKNIRKGNAGEAYINIPIIALTANVGEGIEQQCLDTGMNDYLSKPLDSKLLKQKLAYWLTQKQ